MSSLSERFKGPACGIDGCRTKRYHYDDRGIAVCRNGHEHPEIRERAPVDDDDFSIGLAGQTSRKRKESTTARVLKAFEGSRAFELYLEIWQLILRHQLWFLIKEKGLPQELETLCRSLWALRVQSLRSRLLDDFSAPGSDSERTVYTSQTSTDSESASNFSSTLYQSSKTPALLETVAYCYMGIWLMRLPITLGDVFQWVHSGKLLYYKAAKAIPQDMKDRLPPSYAMSFHPKANLTPTRLHQIVIRLFDAYQDTPFNLQIPDLNSELLLFRLVHDLALPLQTVSVIHRLKTLIGYDFVFPSAQQSRRRIIDFPEVQLISLVIVAVKLLFPFDGRKLFVEASDEPMVIAVNWSNWCQTLQEHKQELNKPAEGRLTFEQCLNITENDAVELNTDQQDDYLDWYENVHAREDVTGKGKDADFRKYLLEAFPKDLSHENPLAEVTDAARAELRLARLLEVVAALKVRPRNDPIQSGHVTGDDAKPGAGYFRYKHVADLEGPALVFHTEAAEKIGLDLKQVLKAVYLTETKLENWEASERKNERMDVSEG